MKDSTLDTLSTVLNALRGYSVLDEIRPAAFHLEGRDFIHFHEEPAGLFADVLLSRGRVRMPVTTAAEQGELLERIDEKLSALESHESGNAESAAAGMIAKIVTGSAGPLGRLTAPLLIVGGIVLLPFALVLLFCLEFIPFSMLHAGQEKPVLQAGIIIAAVLLHAYSVRFYAAQVSSIMRRRVNQERQRAAGRAAVVPDSEGRRVDTPAAAAQVAPDTIRGELRFVSYGREAEALIDTPAERFIRDRLLNRRGKTFLYAVMAALLLSLVAGIGALLVDHPVLDSTGSGIPDGYTRDEAIRLMVLSSWPVFIPYLIAGVVVFFVYRHRLGVGIPTAIFFGFFVNALLVLLGTLATADSATDVPTGHLLLAPLGVYLVTIFAGGLLATAQGRGGSGRDLEGRRLLVLRVFGVERNTTSLFGYIVRRWPFMGPVVTIVDSSYARFTFSRARYALLLIVSLPSLLFVAFVPELGTLWFMFLMTLAHYVCYLPLLLAFHLIRLHLSTGRDLTALEKRLDIRTKGLFRRRYRAIRLVCFEDLWKAVLAKLVGWADVVIMDLRGYDRNRRGCEYELGHLMNHYPLERIAFLTDPTTDRTALRSLLREQFANVLPESPNAGREEVVVYEYESRSAGCGLRREMRAILALLGELITAEAGHEGGVSGEGSASPS